MQKREKMTPLKSWARPAVRRIASGSAESGGGGGSDGSGTFS
jgi:hypothetical protein